FALVRSAGYTLSLITLTGAYYLLLVVGSQLLGYVRRDMSLPETAVNIVVIIMLSTAFQPIKQFFDRITDRIFYRDRYDTNEFITRLGKILTSTTKLHEVLEKSGSEISATLKSSGYEFFVYRDNHPDVQVGTLIKKHFDDEASHTLHQLVTLHHERVIVVSDIEHEHEVAIRQLRSAIERRHISLVVPLMSNEELIGCLLLGEQQGGGYTKRDIRALETVVDSLVIAIQNARSVQVVRDLNTHLEQRVNSATKELRATNRQLIELDTTKDEFVSMASHQLRTPLTSIKGYLSMVLEGDVGKITAEQRQLLDEAFTSSERMVHLISDFLNVSRLQTGKFMIDRKKTDLANVVSQEVESMKQIAESHGMTIRYRQPSVFPVLYIDDDKLRQVIMNFIDNAIYYSPDSRAPIIVKLAVEDGYAVFRVVDKGMGVPVEVQRQLFTKFFRAENARKQRPDGTGIGLYLAKRVIDGHGGKLVFESAEGKGSTFGFRLPVRKLSQPPVERTNDDSEIK
ncbi:MAG: HAMP domain-containing histidine kinase, partial [Candidatus Saccharibacteria bacterium]|nr:HAMP domain-containing histidine kinase [Candidatus Saccharibacteria bacterium]